MLAAFLDPMTPENEKIRLKDAFNGIKAKNSMLEIADRIKMLHTKNGILDITDFLYPKHSIEIFDRTIKLSVQDLQEAETAIQNILISIKNNDIRLNSPLPRQWKEPISKIIKDRWRMKLNHESYHAAVETIIKKLIKKTGANLDASQTTTFINSSIEIVLGTTSTILSPYLFDQIKLTILTSFQKENELAVNQSTQDEIIDITKIFASFVKATAQITQEP